MKIHIVFIAILTVLHFALGLYCINSKSPAFDEPVFLAGGCFYNLRGDFSVNPEGGLLSQRLIALPTYFMPDLKLPEVDPVNVLEQNQQEKARQLIELNVDSFDTIMNAGRISVLVLSCVFAIFLYKVSSGIFGFYGGLISMALYCLCPMIISNATFASADIPLSAFMFAAVYFTWRIFRHINLWNLLLMAATIAGAVLSKMSGLIIVPIYGLLSIVSIFLFTKTRIEFGARAFVQKSSSKRILTLIILSISGVILVYTLLWTAYEFHYSISPANTSGSYIEKSWELISQKSKHRKLFDFLRQTQLLPESFIYGLNFVSNYVPRKSFLNGDKSLSGWWYFFPYGICVKTPFPVLLLLIMAIGTFVFLIFRKSIFAKKRLLFMLNMLIPFMILLLVYGGIAISQKFNIGMRHILPLYPVGFLLCGVLGVWFRRRHKVMIILISAMLAVTAYCNWQIAPHYNSYFNSLAGGFSNGWRIMGDSSLDWGQDFISLNAKLSHIDVKQKVYLAAFANPGIFPERYISRDFNSLGTFFPHNRKNFIIEFTPGIYCISSTIIWNIYGPDLNIDCEDSKNYYKYLCHRIDELKTTVKTQSGFKFLTARDGKEFWHKIIMNYDIFRFMHLCRYLRNKNPDDFAGYSILIYELSKEDLSAALSPL